MFGRLLQSRRFWTFVIAQVISMVVLVANHYIADPFASQLSANLIAFVEGLAGFVIVGYTVDDTITNRMAVKMGTHPYFQVPKSEK